jgi:hypothetical protein
MVPIRSPLAKTLLLLCFVALCGGAATAAPVNLELWARGTLTLYDQAGNVTNGPEDWGVDPPYNWLTASWNGKEAGWSATAEIGSDGWNDSSLRNIGFYYRFLNNKLRVTLGQPLVDYYRVNSYIEWIGYGSRLFNRDYGFLVETYPVAGLVLAGGLAVPPESAPAENVYENVRFGASYSSERFGKFNAGYIHDSIDTDNSDNPDDLKRELMFSADLKYFKPIGLLLGYQGFLDGSGKTSLFGACAVPIRKFTFTNDAVAVFRSGFSYEWRTQLSYLLPFGNVGATGWILDNDSDPEDVQREVGAMAFVTFNVENGFIRFAYTYDYLYKDEKTEWSIPVTYDMWF